MAAVRVQTDVFRSRVVLLASSEIPAITFDDDGFADITPAAWVLIQASLYPENWCRFIENLP